MKRLMFYVFPGLLVVVLILMVAMGTDAGKDELEKGAAGNPQSEAIPAAQPIELQLSPGLTLDLEQVRKERKELEEKLRQYEESLSGWEHKMADL